MFFRATKWAMLWALVILILCGIPGKDIPHISFLELLSFDKFVHAGIFFVLILLAVRGFKVQQRYPALQRKAKLYAFIICVAYGGSLELMQATIFEGRTADIFDFIANSFGCTLGILVYNKAEQWLLARLIRT